MTPQMRLMLLAVAVLAVLVALQYWPGGAPTPQGSQGAQGSPGRAAPGAAVAAAERLNPRAGLDAAAFDDLFAQPLFSPSRQPAEAATATSAPAAAAPFAALAPAPAAGPAVAAARPMLFGTVTSPPPGGAFVGDDAGGSIDYLVPGQSARGLRLVSVGPDSATFTVGDGTERVLRMPAAAATDAATDAATSPTAADAASADAASADPDATDPAATDASATDAGAPDTGAPGTEAGR